MAKDLEPPPKLKAWAAEVDRLMLCDWCIDTSDAGLGLVDLESHWKDGEEPAVFVEWFANKYDLIRFELQLVRSSLSKLPPQA